MKGISSKVIVPIVLLAAALIAVLLISRHQRSSTAEAPVTDKSLAEEAVTAEQPAEAEMVIRIGNGTEPRELDPATSTGVPESHIEDNLFEGLCSYDPFTLAPLPGTAESWDISDDGTVYTFKLRPNLKWSDGKPITAADFVYSWRRALDPKTASEYAYQLYYIKNGAAFNKGEIKDATQLGVEAADELTLVVTLEKPTPYFLNLTSFHTLYPVPRHVVEQHGQEWTKEGKMVSNGPFKLAEWRLNKHIKLVPNEHYWDKDRVKITTAYFMPIENENTEEKAFISGQLHMTNGVPSLKIPHYKELKEREPQTAVYRSSPLLGTYFYRFNVTKKPVDDKRVRRALALTIDRRLIVDKIARGDQVPAWSFTPPNTAGYTYPRTFLNESPTAEDIAEAKRLLAEAGYPNGEGFPKIDLLYNTSEGHKKIATAVQQMWKEHLGIEIGILNQEWKVFLNTVKDLNYHVSRAGWIGDYPDPNTFLDLYVTGGGNNDLGFSNAEYDNYIKMAASEQDHAKRLEYFRKAEDILMDETAVVPIYYYTNNSLVSPQVKMYDVAGNMRDWSSNLSDRILLKYYVLVE